MVFRIWGERSSLSGGALIVFFSQGVGMGLAYLVQVVFARWAGAEAYGTYTFAMAWALLLSTFSHCGMTETAVRYVPTYVRLRKWSLLKGFVNFSERFVLATGLVVVLVGSAFLASVYSFPPNSPQMQALWVGLWTTPLLGALKLQTESCRALTLNATAFALPSLLRPLLMLGAGYAVVLATGTLTGTVAVAVAAGSIIPVWLIQRLHCRRSLPKQAGSAPTRRRSRMWLKVAVPLLFVNATGTLVAQTDLLMIGAIETVEQVGYYRAAARTAAIAALVLTAVNAVVAPRFAALHAEGDRDAMQRLIVHFMPWIVVPTVVVVVVLALAGEWVLGLFGPDFITARPALVVLLTANLFSACAGSVGYLLTMTGHEKTSARILAWCALTNVALNYIGIHLFGLTGAAVATAATTIAWNIWMHRAVTSSLQITPSVLSFLRRTSPE